MTKTQKFIQQFNKQLKSIIIIIIIILNPLYVCTYVFDKN